MRAITFQQLAGAAARTIHGRLVAALDDKVTPERLLTLPEETLRAAGLSANKAASLRDLATKVLDGTVVLDPRRPVPAQRRGGHRPRSRCRASASGPPRCSSCSDCGGCDVWPTGDLGVRKGFALAWHIPMPADEAARSCSASRTGLPERRRLILLLGGRSLSCSAPSARSAASAAALVSFGVGSGHLDATRHPARIPGRGHDHRHGRQLTSVGDGPRLTAPASPAEAWIAPGSRGGPEPSGGSCSWKAVPLVAGLVLAVIYLLSPNVLPRGDAALSVFTTAASLVHHLDLDLAEYEDVPWVPGRQRAGALRGPRRRLLPWLSAAAAIPAVLVVDALSVTGLTPSTDTLIREDRSWIVHYVSAAIWSAAAAVVMGLVVLVAVDRFGLATVARNGLPRLLMRWPVLTAGLLVGLTTAVLVDHQSLARRPCPGGAVRRLWRCCSRCAAAGECAALALAGALCALAFWVRPVALVATFTVVCGAARRAPAAGGSRTSPGAGITHVLVVAADEAMLRHLAPAVLRGRPGRRALGLRRGGGGQRGRPDVGLLVGCPQFLLLFALLVPSVRRAIVGLEGRRLTAIFLLSALAVLVLVSGYRTQWWAGHTYGPRFLTETLPFLLPVTVGVSIILVVDGLGHVSRRAVVRCRRRAVVAGLRRELARRLVPFHAVLERGAGGDRHGPRADLVGDRRPVDQWLADALKRGRAGEGSVDGVSRLQPVTPAAVPLAPRGDPAPRDGPRTRRPRRRGGRDGGRARRADRRRRLRRRQRHLADARHMGPPP